MSGKNLTKSKNESRRTSNKNYIENIRSENSEQNYSPPVEKQMKFEDYDESPPQKPKSKKSNSGGSDNVDNQVDRSGTKISLPDAREDFKGLEEGHFQTEPNMS